MGGLGSVVGGAGRHGLKQMRPASGDEAPEQPAGFGIIVVAPRLIPPSVGDVALPAWRWVAPQLHPMAVFMCEVPSTNQFPQGYIG